MWKSELDKGKLLAYNIWRAGTSGANPMTHEKKVSFMTQLLCISAALVAGLLMTRVMNVFHLPDVTAYLLAGVLLGPCVLGCLGISWLGFRSFEEVTALQPVCDVALGFIAFAIGSEFRLSHLKSTGGAAVVIGVVQAVTATLLVDLSLLALRGVLGDALPLSAVLVLGAIAAATAPAATLMVVRQYKAKGPVTSLLLPVVALDDAVGLMIFAVSFGVAQAMTSQTASLGEILAAPLAEIALSLALGMLLGYCLTFLEGLFHSNRNRVGLITGFIILAVAVSMVKFPVGDVELGFSSLLVCMMLGTVFCNTCKASADLMERADKWSAPLLTLFFVLSGSALDFRVFAGGAIVKVGFVYILARSAGKYAGAWLSSSVTRREPCVRKYLGITLLPQAGVALGMSAQAGATMGETGILIRNVVLFGVLIYELFGPALTKAALVAAGDIQEKDPARRTAVLKHSSPTAQAVNR